MAVNSTVVLTLILLALMFGAGVTSSVLGFTTGREALKGTTQPDVRPSNNAGSGKQGTVASKDQVSILKEKDILKTVKARKTRFFMVATHKKKRPRQILKQTRQALNQPQPKKRARQMPVPSFP
jgi:hypothetical protein